MTDRELMQMALDALIKGIELSYSEYANENYFEPVVKALRARLAQPELMINGLTEEETAATMSVKGLAQPEPKACWCETCRPITMGDMRMVLCPTCGNKRCPHATNHMNECTGSNEPGQKGSSYGGLAQPEPEPVACKQCGFKGIHACVGYRREEGRTPPSVTYTAPPQRKEWQGLSLGEAVEIWRATHKLDEAIRLIEAKLKEKNL